jgi:hypothetical protein
VAGLLRNRWPESIGIGGRLRPESAAGINRNMQFLGRNLIFTMIENVQRQIILHDFIAEAINDMAKKKGINVSLPPKAEF